MTENVNSHYRHIFKPKDQVTKSTNQITEIAEQTLMQDKTVLHMSYIVPFILPPHTHTHKYRVFTMCSFALSHLQTVSPRFEFGQMQLCWQSYYLSYRARPVLNSPFWQRGQKGRKQTGANVSLYIQLFNFWFRQVLEKVGNNCTWIDKCIRSDRCWREIRNIPVSTIQLNTAFFS